MKRRLTSMLLEDLGHQIHSIGNLGSPTARHARSCSRACSLGGCSFSLASVVSDVSFWSLSKFSLQSSSRCSTYFLRCWTICPSAFFCFWRKAPSVGYSCCSESCFSFFNGRNESGSNCTETGLIVKEVVPTYPVKTHVGGNGCSPVIMYKYWRQLLKQA